MLRNSDSHNEKYGWNSIPNSIPKNTLGGSRFNLEINGIFRCLDISFVSLPLNDVTRTSSWLSKSSLFATIDENGDEPRPHLQWWMHFGGLKCRPRNALGVWPRLLRTKNRTAASRCFVCTPTYPISRHLEVRRSNRINVVTPQLLSVTSDFGLKWRSSLPNK